MQTWLRIVGIAVAAGGAFAVAAQAQDTPTDYFSIGIATGWAEEESGGATIDYERGTGLHLAYGRDYGTFRWEVEGLRQEADRDYIESGGRRRNLGGSADALALMVNGWIDIETGTAFTPFIGGGVGVVRFSGDGIAGAQGDSDTSFAAQIGVGMAYQINDSMAIEAALRQFAARDVNDYDVDISSILIGLRFSF
ncbi:MAG: porin family protein [Rhodobacteraceae bacterium]|nr:porin family protein [Paracoccaceae bacterium]